MIDNLGLAQRFDRGLERQFELCRALETLADNLPGRLDTHAAVSLVDRLPCALRQCHLLEETAIYPVVTLSPRHRGPSLDRLHAEHIEDEDHAFDVRDGVVSLVTGRTRPDAEEIGYMLRCLFTSLRRHLAFDQDYVLPLYRRTCGL